MSNDITKKIVDSQLDELGFRQERPASENAKRFSDPAVRRASAWPAYPAYPAEGFGYADDEDDWNERVTRARRARTMERRRTERSIFDDDFGVGKREQTRRTTDRHNSWTRDDVCARLEGMSEAWQDTGESAMIDQKMLDKMVETMATDLANMMEHAGFTYGDTMAPAALADMVAAFVLGRCRVRVGNAVRRPEVR